MNMTQNQASSDDFGVSTSVTHNNNYGEGVINDVHGVQNNYHIIQYLGPPQHSYANPIDDFSPPESYELVPFEDAIAHINVIRDFLISQMDTSKLTFAASFVTNSLLHLRTHFSYACMAFDLLMKAFPETFTSFQYFREFKAFVQYCATPLIELRKLIHLCESSEMITLLYTCMLDYLASDHNWLVAAKKFLSDTQPKLECFLMLISSRFIERLEGNDHVASRQLAALSKAIRETCYPTFRHLRFDCFFLRDHLGNEAPVPLVFCRSWVEFRTIIMRLCKRESDGAEYILKNQWELVRADNMQVIDWDAGAISQVILPELVYEMSIILDLLGLSMAQCPQCESPNVTNDENGWKACSGCNAKYQMSFQPQIQSSVETIRTPNPQPPTTAPITPPPRRFRFRPVLDHLSYLLSRLNTFRNSSERPSQPSDTPLLNSVANLHTNSPRTRFRRISVPVGYGSLKWTEKFLLELLDHRVAPLVPRVSRIPEHHQRVSLLVEELLRIRPVFFDMPGAPNRRRLLSDLLVLAKSIEYHLPSQRVDVLNIVASLGNSEAIPRFRPLGSDSTLRQIVWGQDGDSFTLSITSRLAFCQWLPFDGVAKAKVPYSSKLSVVTDSIIDSSGTYVALGYVDGTINVFEALSGALISSNPGEKRQVRCLAFSNAQPMSIAAGMLRNVIVMDMQTGKQHTPPLKHNSPVTTIAFCPGGQKLASILHDRSICIWNITSGQILYVCQGIQNHTTLVWSPNGKYIFGTVRHDPSSAASGQCFCSLLDAETGKEVVRLRGYGDYASAATFSPDGRFIAIALSGLRTSRAQVWDMESRRAVALYDIHFPSSALQPEEFRIVNLGFSLDGRHLAALTARGEVLVWIA